MATAFTTHRDCWRHDMGAHYPESPNRLGAINNRLISSGLDRHLAYYDAPLANRQQLLRAHSAKHLDFIEHSAATHGIVHVDPDTAMNSGTLNAALRAAGPAYWPPTCGDAGRGKHRARAYRLHA